MSPKPKGKKKKEKKPGRKKRRRDLPAVFDYKDEATLRKFMTDRGKIAARRITGIAAKRQRELATAVKRARHLGLVPFVREHYR